MQIENKKLEEYNAELQGAMTQLGNRLADCQKIMGIIESFLYLVRKESQKINEIPPVSKNGKEE